MIVHCNNADSNLSVGQFLYGVCPPQIFRFWLVGATFLWVIRYGLLTWVEYGFSQTFFFFFGDNLSQFGHPHFWSVHQEKESILVGTEVVLPRPKGYSTHTCFHQLQASPTHRCNLTGPSMDGLGSGGRVLF